MIKERILTGECLNKKVFLVQKYPEHAIDTVSHDILPIYINLTHL